MFKSKTFVKYFISYIGLLIAVFSALTFVFSYVITFTRKQIETSVQEQFEQMGFYFEEKILSLKNTVDLIHNNEYLTHFRLSNGDYMEINGIKELKKIRASNSFINDVFICYKDDYIYSAKGKASVYVYTQDMLALNTESAATVRKVILHSLEPGFYSLYSGIDSHNDQPIYMLCSYPLKSSGRTIGTVGFIVSSAIIKKTLANSLGDYGSGVRMLLPSDQTIVEVNRLGGGPSFDDRNKEANLYYSYSIDTIGFTLNIAIDSARVFSHIGKLQKSSYVTITIVFALSILLSYLFSKKHYKPIKILNGKAMECSKKSILIDTGNEFDAILKVINHEKFENRKLMQKLEESSFTLRQQACGLLFSGVIHGEDRIRNLIDLSEIKIEKPYYSVMIIIERERNWENYSIFDIAKQFSKRFGGYYITSIMDNSAVAFIIGLDDWDSTRKKRRRISKEVQKYFKRENAMVYCACFGRVYDDFSFISNSYEEAVICAEQCLLSYKKNTYAFFETITRASENKYCFDVQDVRELIENLEKKDLRQGVDCFNKILKKLHSKDLSIEAQRFHYHDLLCQVFHYFNRNDMKQYMEEMLIIDCNSTEKFSLQMEKLFQLICSDTVHEMQPDVICDIISYLKDNYSNSNISLSLLARQFHLSPNYISRFFKENTGQNYIEYLSNLRLKEAYRLICNTDIPIQKIVLKVGYLDSVNFTKKFKKTYQITPSELRMRKSINYAGEICDGAT